MYFGIEVRLIFIVKFLLNIYVFFGVGVLEMNEI